MRILGGSSANSFYSLSTRPERSRAFGYGGAEYQERAEGSEDLVVKAVLTGEGLKDLLCWLDREWVKRWLERKVYIGKVQVSGPKRAGLKSEAGARGEMQCVEE